MDVGPGGKCPGVAVPVEGDGAGKEKNSICNDHD